MDCRSHCGACCIAPSISSPLPGMPQGKPAGVRCANLTEDKRCRFWGTTHYPKVCREFIPESEICGTSFEEAMQTISQWEKLTKPC